MSFTFDVDKIYSHVLNWLAIILSWSLRIAELCIQNLGKASKINNVLKPWIGCLVFLYMSLPWMTCISITTSVLADCNCAYSALANVPVTTFKFTASVLKNTYGLTSWICKRKMPEDWIYCLLITFNLINWILYIVGKRKTRNGFFCQMERKCMNLFWKKIISWPPKFCSLFYFRIEWKKAKHSLGQLSHIHGSRTLQLFCS